MWHTNPLEKNLNLFPLLSGFVGDGVGAPKPEPKSVQLVITACKVHGRYTGGADHQLSVDKARGYKPVRWTRVSGGALITLPCRYFSSQQQERPRLSHKFGGAVSCEASLGTPMFALEQGTRPRCERIQSLGGHHSHEAASTRASGVRSVSFSSPESAARSVKHTQTHTEEDG